MLFSKMSSIIPKYYSLLLDWVLRLKFILEVYCSLKFSLSSTQVFNLISPTYRFKISNLPVELSTLPKFTTIFSMLYQFLIINVSQSIFKLSVREGAKTSSGVHLFFPLNSTKLLNYWQCKLVCSTSEYFLPSNSTNNFFFKMLLLQMIPVFQL